MRITRRRRGIGALIVLVLAIGAAGALWVSLAGAEGPTPIKCGSEAKKTTEAIEKAVERGGTYVLECLENPDIEVPISKVTPANALAEGFKVPSGTSVTLIAQPGTQPTFENNEHNRQSRLFTVEKGGSLTLEGVALSASTTGPSGVSAGKAKLKGEKGEPGEEKKRNLPRKAQKAYPPGKSMKNQAPTVAPGKVEEAAASSAAAPSTHRRSRAGRSQTPER